MDLHLTQWSCPARKVSIDLGSSSGTFGNDIVMLGQDRGRNGIVPPSELALIENCMTYIEDVLESLFTIIAYCKVG